MTAFRKDRLFENGQHKFCPILEQKYLKQEIIGGGTFGEVYSGFEKGKRGKRVALKKIRMAQTKEGFPITVLREMKILQRLDHENVVKLQDICHAQVGTLHGFQNTFYLVFDFCEFDLQYLLSYPGLSFKVEDIKNLVFQLLNGLHYIHDKSILHRDLKAANILVTRQGVVKLADFGLSRTSFISSSRRHTNCVVTLWYRPPELLLGARNYGPEIDMWAVGCILAEMWLKKPLLLGSSEMEQLRLITNMCGSLNEDVWPGIHNLDLYKKVEFEQNMTRKVKQRMLHLMKNEHAADLIDRLLCLYPPHRMNCQGALNHDFFWQKPGRSDTLAPVLANLKTRSEYVQQQQQHQQNGKGTQCMKQSGNQPVQRPHPYARLPTAQKSAYLP